MNDFKQASQFLAHLDPDWSRLVTAVGVCTHKTLPEHAPYEALVRTIAFQQLHSRAAEAILGRLLIQYDNRLPSPQQLSLMDEQALRACGFSGRKIVSLKAIAEAALSGLVPNRHSAQQMPTEDLIKHLSTLPGVGRWTVEMLLIYNLERMDIFPADDFGVRNGYRQLKSLADMPKRKTMLQVAEICRPFGTIAAWYLWRAAALNSTVNG